MAGVSLLLILASIFVCSLSQAPGDGSSYCLQENIDGASNPFFVTRPAYAADVRALMDSRDYMSLLIGEDAVWQGVDADSNNMHGVATHWFQLSATPCRGNVIACGFTAGIQENWLIIQHISRQLSSGQLFDKVSVHIEYELNSCFVNHKCRRSLDLYKWETSRIDSDEAKLMDNFVRVGSFAPNSTYNGTVLVNQTIDVIFTTEETGVYLAFLDEGTCVVIQRVLVFYVGGICSGNTTGLVVHPEVLPPQDRVEGTCVANSYSLNGSEPVLRCTDQGDWEVVFPCQCGAGYELKVVENITTCTECMPGTFSESVSNEPCLPCPKNSVIIATQVGLTRECPCIEGYFKAPTDGYDMPCTRSPSPPLNLTVSDLTNTSVVISWLPPLSTGGRNLSEIYYTVTVYGPDQESSSVNVFYVSRTVLPVMGLTPGTQYTFSVTAENAVSSQDTNINARTANIAATTYQGVPSTVEDIQEHCTVVVWKRPSKTNGHISHYIVTFSRDNQSRSVLIDALYHYYVIESDDIPAGVGAVTVEVRAENALGLGPRPQQTVSIGCLNESPTQTPEPCPEVTCPTCPSLPACSPLACPPCPSPLPSFPTSPPSPSTTLPHPTVTCSPCPSSTPCPAITTTVPKETTSVKICPTPTPCPPCEACPTCEPPTSCPDCHDCPIVACPSVPACPQPTSSTLACHSTCPTQPCPTCPPIPTCPPTPTCPPPLPCIATCPTLPPPTTCPPCEGCPAEEVIIPGLVSSVRLSLCNMLSWDLPRNGGKCISEYRVRIYNGRTYASSTERRVLKAYRRNVTLNWIPSHGTTTIIVRAKNNVGFAASWSDPFYIGPDAISCANP